MTPHGSAMRSASIRSTSQCPRRRISRRLRTSAFTSVPALLADDRERSAAFPWLHPAPPRPYIYNHFDEVFLGTGMSCFRGKNGHHYFKPTCLLMTPLRSFWRLRNRRRKLLSLGKTAACNQAREQQRVSIDLGYRQRSIQMLA
jgi:hypothetical protein